MKLLFLILTLSIGAGFAANRPSGYSTDFTPSKDFSQCIKPLFFLGLFVKCAPFRTNADWDRQRFKIIGQGLKNGFGHCKKITPNETEKLKPFLNFNIYKEGEFDQVVNGKDFTKNPKKYVDINSPIIFMMGGIYTDCGIDLQMVARQYDWRTHCAKALYDHRKYAQAIVINWGGLSCKNYNCLVTRCIRPIGELLGKMFAEKFNPRLVTLVGQSIAGHIFAIACNHIRDITEQSVRIGKYIGLDIAGPLVGGRRYLLFYQSKLDFEPNIEMADKTIIIYSNPDDYGTALFDRLGVNIHVNRHNGYKQPGAKGILKAVYYHAFAAMLAAGMSSNTSCYATGSNRTAVNIFYDDIPNGIYDLTVTKCWPFCCDSQGSH